MQALKKFMAVSKHYFDIEEDQFDFHSYCIRKMTLRAYIEMLRMVRNLVNMWHAPCDATDCTSCDVVSHSPQITSLSCLTAGGLALFGFALCESSLRCHSDVCAAARQTSQLRAGVHRSMGVTRT